jgi:hypothetical protein
LLDIASCKLTRTDNWQDNEIEGIHFQPNLKIQIIPFQTLDFAATSNPQVDYKDWFDFVKNSFTQMTDVPSNYQIFIPDHYVQLDKNITTYDVGDKGVLFKDLNVDNFNKKDFERLIRDLIKVSDPEIDFAGADQFWFVGPPNITRTELVNWGNQLSIKTDEGDWHSFYVTDPIYSFDSPSWNFAGPYGTLHEVMRMTDGTLNGHFGLDGQSGTYPWGNEQGGWTDYLVWDKWLAKMVSDQQVMCAKPDTSGTYWIRPNAVKTDQEKLEWEKQAYGMTKVQLNLMVKEQAFPGQEMMFAAGLLSDAQQIMDPEFSDEGWVSPQTANQARQYINCAKAIMFDIMDPSRKAVGL